MKTAAHRVLHATSAFMFAFSRLVDDSSACLVLSVRELADIVCCEAS